MWHEVVVSLEVAAARYRVRRAHNGREGLELGSRGRRSAQQIRPPQRGGRSRSLLRHRVGLLTLITAAVLLVLGGGRASGLGGVPSYDSAFGSAGTGNGQFALPVSLALTPGGNLLVADQQNNRVQEFTTDGTWVQTIGASQGISQATGVAVDSSGMIYVADSGNHRVLKFNAAGAFQTSWGSVGNGDGQFVFTAGVAIAGDGDVLVTDLGNDRVQRFTSAGVFESKFGTSGLGDGQFDEPYDIAVADSGEIFVSERAGDRVQAFTDAGVFIRRVDSGAGSGAGQVDQPLGVAVDSAGDVFVADTGNDRVNVYSTDGPFRFSFGSTGSGAGQLDDPRDVLPVGNNTAFVADSQNNRVQKWVAPSAGGTLTVDSNSDTNDGTCGGSSNCTLREAINAANAAAGLDEIEFDVDGNSLAVGSGGLPPITDAVSINGDNAQDTNPFVLDGDGAGSANGLLLGSGSDGSTVTGLEIINFGGAAIRIESGDNTVTDNVLRSSDSGVFVEGTYSDATGNTIGPGNTITANVSYGVGVVNEAENRITQNSTFGNGGEGISLSGTTPVQTPQIVDALSSGLTTVAITVSGSTGQQFDLELFTNSACDPSGFGEGETFVASDQVTLTDDSETFELEYSGLDIGDIVTATATRLDIAETSEFSNCVTVEAGGGGTGGTLSGALRRRAAAFDLTTVGSAGLGGMGVLSGGGEPNGQYLPRT